MTASEPKSVWAARSEPLAGGRSVKVAVESGGAPVSYAEVLTGWQGDAGFRTFFTALLADAPYPAFRWETPPITAATAGRPFEFVLLDDPGLARRTDPEAFAEHFGGGERGVVTFPNLGGDATLVVPCPVDPGTSYGHLAVFLRSAPGSQRHALWEAVGAAVTRRLGAAPVWVSTAGAGVSWLHVRLDDRPKYYGHGPYRSAGRSGP